MIRGVIAQPYHNVVQVKRRHSTSSRYAPGSAWTLRCRTPGPPSSPPPPAALRATAQKHSQYMPSPATMLDTAWMKINPFKFSYLADKRANGTHSRKTQERVNDHQNHRSDGGNHSPKAIEINEETLLQQCEEFIHSWRQWSSNLLPWEGCRRRR